MNNKGNIWAMYKDNIKKLNINRKSLSTMLNLHTNLI